MRAFYIAVAVVGVAVGAVAAYLAGRGPAAPPAGEFVSGPQPSDRRRSDAVCTISR